MAKEELLEFSGMATEPPPYDLTKGHITFRFK